MKDDIKKRGGARQGSGRKKSKIESTVIGIRVPVNLYESLKAKYGLREIPKLIRKMLNDLNN